MILKMKKYFLLAIISSVVLVGCQQVEETSSKLDSNAPAEIEISKKENTAKPAKENTDVAVSTDASIDEAKKEAKKEVEKNVERKVEKKSNPKQIAQKKPTKKTSKPKKPKKKLSTDLVKNTKTASSKKPKGPLPAFEFEYKNFDFGTVDEGDTVIHKFKFKNIGDAPAIISDASSSCGCTVPEYPKKPIKPGASGVIKVMFDTKGKLLEQKKSITIKANTEPNYTTLYLEGLVYRKPVKKEEKKGSEKKKDAKASKKKKDVKKGKEENDSLKVEKKAPNKKDTDLKEKVEEELEEQTKTDSLKKNTVKNLDKPKKKKP